MRRLERLHAITNHLRARAPRAVSATSLAARFGVSARTIERDLRSLNDAGVPVYGVAGRGGGYAILPDSSLPPLQLTAQEATACLAALTLLDGSPLEAPARTALDKLTAGLPAALLASVTTCDLRTLRDARPAPTGAWLDACREHTLVEIEYDGGGDARLVEPYTTLEAGGRWYLVAWCRTRDGVRGFRTDRVSSLRDTGEPFEPRHAGDVALDLARWATKVIT